MIFRSYFAIENEEGSNFGGEDRPNAINQDISSTGKCFSLLTLVPAKPWTFFCRSVALSMTIHGSKHTPYTNSL